MKIGIIVCDNVAAELAKDHGEYADMISASLSEFAHFEFEQFHAVAQQLPTYLKQCDGYIITGSTHDAYADQPWIHELAAWIRQVDAQKIPLFGICFGHQIIAIALGGRVEKSTKGWGLGVSINQITQQPDWMTPKLDTLHLLVSHQDQVVETPQSLTVVARSEFCPNYMLAKDQHILTVQGHPEFSLAFERRLIERKRALLTDQQYDHALTSLELPPHSAIVMQWVANFLRR